MLQKPRSDLQIRSLLLAPLLARLRAAGFDPAALIERLHLPPDAERAPSVTLSLTTLRTFFDAAEQLLEDPRLGIHMAQDVGRGMFGVVEFSCEAAPTVRDGLARLSRYHALLNDVADIVVRDKDDLIVVEHSIPGAPLCVGRLANEFFVVNLILQSRRVTRRPFVPRYAFFAHLAPKDTSELERVLGTRAISFEAGKNGFAIDARDGAAPILTADPALGGVLEGYAEHLLTERPPPSRLLDQVRLEVQARLSGGPPSLEILATALHIAPRTLQRRLSDEGTSLTEIVEKVREELARARVLDPTRTMESLAFGLGYADPRAFLRAFKRWTGTTPGHYRARARTQGAVAR